MTVTLLFAALIYPFFNDLWYITAPEVLYITYLAVRMAGPWGLIVWPLYCFGIMAAPPATMILVGAVLVIRIIIVLFRSVAGDQIARNKEGEMDNGANGVPRMTGENKETQEALDKLKNKGLQ